MALSESLRPVSTNESVSYKNPVSQRLAREIYETGKPIPFSTYMKACVDSYYGKGKVRFGEIGKGDFLTNPEISEIFGATLAKACMQVWEQMERPAKFSVVELGAGQGGLALGLLSFAQLAYPEFYEAIQYEIVEFSRPLIEMQQTRLSHHERKVVWHNASALEMPESLKNVEGAIISNELIDAFPVDIVKRVINEDGTSTILQKFVALEVNESGEDTWVEQWAEPTTEVAQAFAAIRGTLPEGVEEPINTLGEKCIWEAAHRLQRGMLLTIDYGKEGLVGEPGESPIRTYGQSTNPKDSPYDTPGEIDLTVSVNFRPLAIAGEAAGLDTAFLGGQYEFFGRFVGLKDIFRMYVMQLHATASLTEKARITRNLENFYSLIKEDDAKLFYFLCQTKGIQLTAQGEEDFSTDSYERSEDEVPAVFIHPIGLRGVENMMPEGSKFGIDNTLTTRDRRIKIRETNAQGRIGVFWDELLDGMIIYLGRVELFSTIGKTPEQIIADLEERGITGLTP